MERALQDQGFATLNLGYPSRKYPLEVLVDRVHDPINAFAAGTDALHFVTHSMGGLLARLYLARYRPRALQRVVMLGPPNNGSELADLFKDVAPFRTICGPAGQQLGTMTRGLFDRLPSPDYGLGIIAGNRTIDPVSSYFVVPRPNDGKVSVESTRLEGMADHIVLDATHGGLMRHREVIAQTIAFLRDGRFLRNSRVAKSSRRVGSWRTQTQRRPSA
jgi:pimeloyl-ACP methyl ester carboxylesterase